MPRGLPTLLVLYVLLCATSAVLYDFRIAFVGAAAAALLLIFLGILLFPRLRFAFPVAVPAIDPNVEMPTTIRVAGAKIPLQPYMQVATCVLQVARLEQLVACGALSIAAVVTILSGHAAYDSLLHGFGLFQLEFACGGGAAVLLASYLWTLECLDLRTANVILAPITNIVGLVGRQQLTYEFYDPSGSRYGGYTTVFGNMSETVVVTFYDPKNPDKSRTHCSLRFHSVRFLAVSALQTETSLEHHADTNPTD